MYQRGLAHKKRLFKNFSRISIIFSFQETPLSFSDKTLRRKQKIRKLYKQLHTCDLDMGKPMPTALELIIEKFILCEEVIVVWEGPIKSKRSAEFEAVGAWPEAGCELLKSSIAGCCATLLKSSPDEALGQGEAWLKALQSPKSPFPLVAVPEGNIARGDGRKGRRLRERH